MQSDFVLHPQLEADTLPLRELPLCQVRIMDNATLPWLILVPRVAGASEIVDLDSAVQEQLMREIVECCHALKQAYQPDKLNVAALGNVVPQLHIHVIARYRNDPAWPNPVWGNLPKRKRTKDEFQSLRDRLTRHWPQPVSGIFASALSSMA